MGLKKTIATLILTLLTSLLLGGCDLDLGVEPDLEGMFDWGDWELFPTGGPTWDYGGGGSSDPPPPPPEFEFYGSAENDNRIVVVGTHIVISTDGIVWTDVTPESITVLHDVIWTGWQFLAVGSEGLVASSIDGQSWTVHPKIEWQNFRSVIWNGSRYLATSMYAGSGKAVLSSYNGRDWVMEVQKPGWYMGSGIVQLSEKYVTSGLTCFSTGPLSGTNCVSATLTWDEHGSWSTHVQEPYMYSFDHMIEVDDHVTAVNRSGYFTSTDGVVWDQLFEFTNPYPRWARQLAWSGETYVGFPWGAYVQVSTDGANWQKIEGVYPGEVYDLRWTGRRFIILGPDKITMSYDGQNWTETCFGEDDTE